MNSIADSLKDELQKVLESVDFSKIEIVSVSHTPLPTGGTLVEMKVVNEAPLIELTIEFTRPRKQPNE
jgi:hypothetical protein